MRKNYKRIPLKSMGNEGYSLAIALFFFLLCSILCAGMLGMGLSSINSASILLKNSENDVNAINPAVVSMLEIYADQIKNSGLKYYPEKNQINTHLSTPIGYVVEDLCYLVNSNSKEASRTLTIVFDDVSTEGLPTLSDERYGFEVIVVMDTNYNIMFCLQNSSCLARIDAVYNDELAYYEWC